MNTPFDVFLRVVQLDGELGILSRDRLWTSLPDDCPVELKDAIRQRKAALLDLLRLNFLVVRSDVLKTTVLWTPDEATKKTLSEAGADAGNIYTAAELKEIVKCRITAVELPSIHAVKHCFHGRLVEFN